MNLTFIDWPPDLYTQIWRVFVAYRLSTIMKIFVVQLNYIRANK